MQRPGFERINAMQCLIFMEESADGLDSTTKQIISGVKKIATKLEVPIRGICVGSHLEGMAAKLDGLIDELIAIESRAGYENNTEELSNVLTDIISKEGPALLFFGFTHLGMELAPTIGWRLKVPVITSCVHMDWDGQTAHFKRPILGGKLLAAFSAAIDKGAVISVQRGAWKDETKLDESTASIPIRRLAWQPSWDAKKTEVVGIYEEVKEGEEDITKAEILVSAGRGIGDPDNLPIIKELADNLGGMISCSRPVVDMGWLPASRQVGISGRTVAPIIYLALGISGQTNHVVGMDTSGTIIAVNKDPLAPVFNVAHYGVVDDILQFVPELIEQLKNK